MRSTSRFVAGALSVCAPVAVAQGAWVGGAMVSTQAWNDAATAALGQQASVYRLFFAFDSTAVQPVAVYEPNINIGSGVYYDDPFGTDLPPNISLEPLVPGIRWDTYMAMGSLHQPSLAYIGGNGDIVIGATRVFATTDDTAWINFPAGGENIPRAPGSPDINGEMVIPGDFDSSLFYTFAGQFTVLGHEADLDGPLTFDGGFIDGADFFSGSIELLDTSNNFRPIQIVPAPSGALVLCIGLLAGRRTGGRR